MIQVRVEFSDDFEIAPALGSKSLTTYVREDSELGKHLQDMDDDAWDKVMQGV